MKKVTKKKQIEDLQTVVAAQWRQINKLKLVVGRLTDDWPDDDHEQADHDAVIAILDSKEPKLKQLDHSVFDGLDEKWRFAAVSGCSSKVQVYDGKPELKDWYFTISSKKDGARLSQYIGTGYDTTDWQNSLIERDKVELTGSELCKAMKNKNDWVLAYVSDENDATAEFHQRPAIVTGATIDGRFKCGEITWRFAVPINNQGEPLTAADAGL